jgi:bacterial leucyl aminopeptidase
MRAPLAAGLALALAAIAAACSSPAPEPDVADGDLFVIVAGGEAAEVDAFLGPDQDGRSRLVSTVDDRSILRASEPELDQLAGFFHDKNHRCGGFTAHLGLAEAEEALASEHRGESQVALTAPLALAEPDTVEALIPLVDAGQILDTIAGLSAFPSRHYQSAGGVEAASWLRDRWTAMAVGRAGVTVELFPHPAWAQPSVLMTIPGDELPDEVVVVGGHLDSINSSGGTSAPGADDDASGVATLTEVARLILSQEIRLRRTVVFMAYAAEEVGLRGSAAIAQSFAANSVPVTGVLQLDMTNFDGSPFDIVLITDNVDPTQTDFLADLAAAYVPEFPVSRDACGYACSDHASWTRNGYPSAFPFEATLSTYNRTIHTANDRLSVSGNNANHAAKFAKLGVAYVVEMAEVPDAPPAATVRLAQVAYDVPGVDRLGELVDLENTGSQAVSLAGWSLSDGTASWSFPAGASIPAGGFASVASDAAGFTALYGVVPDIAGLSFRLANGAGDLFLRDPSGAEIDHVGWEQAGWRRGAASGRSLLRTAEVDTDTVADWTVSPAVTPLGGSAP